MYRIGLDPFLNDNMDGHYMVLVVQGPDMEVMDGLDSLDRCHLLLELIHVHAGRDTLQEYR